MIIVFMKELAKMLEEAAKIKGVTLNIKCFSLHPGVIKTNIGNDVLAAKIIKTIARFWMKTPQ
jgi:hypothetical protein